MHTVHELQSKASRDDAINLRQSLSESKRVIDELFETIVDVPGAPVDQLPVQRRECAAGASECDYVSNRKVRSEGIEDWREPVRAEYGDEIGHAESIVVGLQVNDQVVLGDVRQ